MDKSYIHAYTILMKLQTNIGIKVEKDDKYIPEIIGITVNEQILSCMLSS